jgi:class 3 adenylate cyclase
MPLFMDVHAGLGDATPDDVAEAHRHDLAIQDQFGVKFLSYWFADPQGKAFCLVEAPDADSAKACHKAAHGLMPHDIIEVAAPTLEQFMGKTENDEDDRATVDGHADTALRAIMFTDIEGSTAISTGQGDQAAMEIVHRHDQIVRGALERFGGREVKHTGDGVFASFTSVLRAVEASIAIQRQSRGEPAPAGSPDLMVKIGLTVGEPVEDSDDLFGASVNLAARICAHAGGGQTLASGTVRDLAVGKNIDFIGQGAIGLKGFPDPVPLFEVGWAVNSESGGGPSRQDHQGN